MIIGGKNWLECLNLCRKGQHKFRENKFGVIWCVRCGQLSNARNAQPLLKNDIHIIHNNN